MPYEKEHQRDAETYTSRTQQSYRCGRYGGLSTADCKNLQLQSSRHQQLVEPLSADRPGTRPGEPRVTTLAEDRYIRTIHLRNRFVTATSTAAKMTTLGHSFNRRTVFPRLGRAGNRAFRPFRGLQWARTVRRWQRRDWERVLFTDENRFNMFRNDGQVHVY